ncbi:hypothetical protein BST61_g9353 [Cercospora zeina]
MPLPASSRTTPREGIGLICKLQEDVTRSFDVFSSPDRDDSEVRNDGKRTNASFASISSMSRGHNHGQRSPMAWEFETFCFWTHTSQGVFY